MGFLWRDWWNNNTGGGVTTSPLLSELKIRKDEFSVINLITIFSCLIPIYSVFFIYQPVSLNDF